MFFVLERYIGKIILKNIIITLFILVSLSSIIKFIDQLRRVGQGTYTVLGAGLFTLLSLPKDIELFFPMAALLGALFGLGQLAMHNELLVMQTSGFTRIKIVSAVIKTAIPLVFLTIGIGEYIVPQGNKMAKNFRTQQIYGSSFLSTNNGLWAKDGNDFIFIERVSSEKELYGLNVYHFNEKFRLEMILYASSARFKDGVWTLWEVHISDFKNEKQVIGTKILLSEWYTNLTPEKLRIAILDPTSLSIGGLHDYVKYMKQMGQQTKRYQLIMWNKIFSPFSVAVMMLMAISFILGPLRNVVMGIRVVTGISLGFLFYILNQFFTQLTLIYNISSILGAILPSIIFLLISMHILIKGK